MTAFLGILVSIVLNTLCVTSRSINIDAIKATEEFWHDAKPQINTEISDPLTGLFYQEYLIKVTDALSNDKFFQQQMQNIDRLYVENPNIKLNLGRVNLHMKNKLNQIKRDEVDRINKLVRAQRQLEGDGMISPQLRKAYLDDIAGHFDHSSHSFNEKDFTKLLSRSLADLQEFDQDRHDRFKRYHMFQKMQHDKTLAGLETEEARTKYRQHLREQKFKHADHQPVNFPASRDHLVEIWNEEDGHKDEEFSPVKFFDIHDANRDGWLDIREVEALMEHELKKVYDAENEEDDMVAKEEERMNMRKHFFMTIDKNRDMIISKKEFVHYVTSDQFEKTQTEWGKWQTVNDMIEAGHIYNGTELEEYQQEVRELTRKYETAMRERYSLDRHVKKQAENFLDMEEQFKRHGQSDTPIGKQKLADQQIKLESSQGRLQNLTDQLGNMANTLKEMQQDLYRQTRLSEYAKAEEDQTYRLKLGNFEKRKLEAEKIMNDLKKDALEIENEVPLGVGRVKMHNEVRHENL